MMGISQKFSPGATVWVPHDQEVFVEGVVISQEEDKVRVDVGLSSRRVKEIMVNSSDCFAKEEEVVDDMTKLVYLHEAGVLNNLHCRYSEEKIYTYTGNILIAVNPFQRFPSLYDASMRSNYQGKRLGEIPPHIFAVADSAYRAMSNYKVSQSILISGESGAGKTETTKLVMEYLAGVGGRARTNTRSVESQVLESNPLLEAFGNAKTVRNNNSSRFGKYIEIQFNKWGRVSGAAIRTYLLERSRVVKISSPERNFHCFYQLCYGISAEQASKYRLPSSRDDRAKHFHYLNQSKCFELDGVDNSAEFKHTSNSMDVLGITKEEQDSIWKIVSAILHLGNVNFSEAEDHNEALKPSDPQSKYHLDIVSELLQCDREWLERSLVHKFRKISNQIVAGRIDAKSAITMRDSLAKNLYSKLFDWIVEKVNVAIGEDPDCEASIGVLDIYGFEHFKTNSFEQFCINLANEKLQQHFNMHVLKMEQEEYEREEINWSRIPFTDNQDRLDLIEKDKGSILSILDSDSKLGTKTSEGFTRTLHKEFSDHPRFIMAKTSRTEFTLDHYAGKVKYSTDEFLSKNVDAVVPEHHRLLSQSKDQVLRDIFSEESAPEVGQFTSIGLSFKSQLTDLMEILNSTEPHYVRCVKPNPHLRPHIFERSLVMTQLRSGGVLEAVRMCSAGYPTRRTFKDFLDRFWVLARQNKKPGLSEKKLCEVLMEHTGLSDYQVGITKIFLRAGHMVALDTLLSTQNESARKIQRHIRLLWFIRERRGAIQTLQTWWRSVLGRREFSRRESLLTKTALILQKTYRMKKERVHFLVLKATTIFLQKLLRKKIERDLALVAQIRHGLDLKTSSRAELIARAKLDKVLGEISQLEGEVDSKAQGLVEVQGELTRAKERAIELAHALEKITGESESVLDSLLIQETEEEEHEPDLKEEEMRIMEYKLKVMETKLREKEEEVKLLANRLAILPALLKRPELPANQEQALLLSEIARKKFGFTKNRVPIAAGILFKALIRWKAFDADRTNVFDQIVEIIQMSTRDADEATLAYWLSNSIHLYYFVDNFTHFHISELTSQSPTPKLPFRFFGVGVQEKKERVSTMIFKVLLRALIERIFVIIQDKIKTNFSTMLMRGQQDASQLRNGETQHFGLRFNSSLRAEVSEMWNFVLSALISEFEYLRENHVPPILIHLTLKQSLAFLNMKVFNSVMAHNPSFPCTFTNGLAMGEGLSKLIDWLREEVEPWIASVIDLEVPSLVSELSHIQQVVFFLLTEEKPSLSLDDITGLCPDLSITQLVHLCLLWSQQDKSNSSSVDSSVIELMWAHNENGKSMLLKDNESIPFTIEDIMECMDEVIIDNLEAPPELLEKGLHFLVNLNH